MPDTEGTALSPLSEHEMTRLAHCEAVVETGLCSFLSIGRALYEIQQNRLYRAKYASFDTYLRERWGISKQRAHQVCFAASVADILRDTPTTSGEVREILPMNERQVRALSGVDESNLGPVWDAAVEAAGGGHPTHKQVTEAVEKFEAEQTQRKPPNVLHSSESNEWYTPSYIIEPVRSVIGGFDLDPASCAKANETVHAHRWIGLPQNGLEETWRGRVWCNPPYGRAEGQSSQAAWLQKAIVEVGRGACDVVAMLVNAHVGTKWFRAVWQYPVCILDERVRFVGPDGKPGDSPTHGSIVVLVTRDPVAYESAMSLHLRDLGVISLPTEFDRVIETGEPGGE